MGGGGALHRKKSPDLKPTEVGISGLQYKIFTLETLRLLSCSGRIAPKKLSNSVFGHVIPEFGTLKVSGINLGTVFACKNMDSFISNNMQSSFSLCTSSKYTELIGFI